MTEVPLLKMDIFPKVKSKNTEHNLLSREALDKTPDFSHLLAAS